MAILKTSLKKVDKNNTTTRNIKTSVGDPDPDPHVFQFLGLRDPDPIVRGTDPDPSLFSSMC
jgi:hypothetical protein